MTGKKLKKHTFTVYEEILYMNKTIKSNIFNRAILVYIYIYIYLYKYKSVSWKGLHRIHFFKNYQNKHQGKLGTLCYVKQVKKKC